MYKFKILLMAGIILIFSLNVYSQDSSSVPEYNKFKNLAISVLEKNRIIKDITSNKTNRDDNITDYGYMYTKAKAFKLPLNLVESKKIKELIDGIFFQCDQNGLLTSNSSRPLYYRVDGQDPKWNTYAKEKPRLDEITGINISYYKRNDGTFEIIEILIIKKTDIPNLEEGEGEEEGTSRVRGQKGQQRNILYQTEYDWYSLSGTNLKKVVSNTELNNQFLSLYYKRANTDNVDLSPYFPPPKPGPVLVSSTYYLNKFTNQFNNTKTYAPTPDPKPDKPVIGEGVDYATIRAPNTVFSLGDKSTIKKPISFSNKSKSNIRIENVSVDENDNNQWKIKDFNRVVESNKSVNIDVEYSQAKNGREDYANVLIKWKTLDKDSSKAYTSKIPIIGKTKWEPPSWSFDISPFFIAGLARSIKTDWSFSFKMGNEEIGYPYWSTGNLSLLAGYKNIIKFGLVLPVGLNDAGFELGPLVGPLKKIQGSFGLAAEFNLQTTTVRNINQAFALGGYVFYGKISNGLEHPYKPEFFQNLLNKDFNPVNMDNDFFYVPFVAQLYYPTIFIDDTVNTRNIFQVKAGISYHQIKRAHIYRAGDKVYDDKGNITSETVDKNLIGKVINLDVVKKVPSPLIKIEYTNLNQSNNFGFGLQYSNNIIDFSGWLEVIKDFLRIEGTYVQPLRTAEEWENSAFFWFSPRIYFP
jgi:hypothetical protein